MRKPYLITLLLGFLLPLYLFGQAPVITSFSPVSAPAGAELTISGSNFNTSATSNLVLFGSIKAVVASASANTIKVTVPAGAASLPVTVLNLSTHLSAASAASFSLAFDGRRGISPIQFDRPAIFSPGLVPFATGLADIDQDGKPDLLALNRNSFTLSVYRNIAISGKIETASFATKVDFAAGDLQLSHITIADLDNDGRPDVAATANGGTNGSNGAILVFHNTSLPGNISFDAPINYSAAGYTATMAAADMDGDGRLDLVGLNLLSAGNTVTIYQNKWDGAFSTGSFATTKTFAAPNAVYIDVAELSGDSKPDIIVANYRADNLSVMQNISAVGAVAFDTGIIYEPTLPTDFKNVTTADLDGDGKRDIITYTSVGDVSVLRNTYTGGAFSANSFAAKVDFAGNAKLIKVLASDLDGDGKPEIIMANSTSVSLSVLQNKTSPGNITAADFANRTNMGFQATTAEVDEVGSLTTGDIDGDSRPDILVLSNATLTVAAMRNNPQYTPVITGISPESAAVGEQVIISGLEFNTDAAKNIVYFGPVRAKVDNATATALTVTVPAGATYAPVSVFNTGPRLTAYSQIFFNPQFTFKQVINANDYGPAVKIASGEKVADINYGDIDGDGKTDVIVLNENDQLLLYRNLSVSGSITNASFAPAVVFKPGEGSGKLIVKDINGDGKPDILVQKNKGRVLCYFNKALPGTINTSSPVPEQITQFDGTTAIASADIDGDGQPDIITATSGGFDDAFYVRGNTSANGILKISTLFSLSNKRGSIAACAGDLDADGRPDVVLGNLDGTISILKNTSVPTTIAFAPKFDLPLQVTAIEMADMNGDGKPDLVLGLNHTIGVLINKSVTGTLDAASFEPMVTFAIATGSLGQIADINGDGKPDIIVNDGNASVLLNNSAGATVTFGAKVVLAKGSKLKIADLDGDGNPDLVFQAANLDVVVQRSDFKAGGGIPVAPPGAISFDPALGKAGTALVINGENFAGDTTTNVVYMGAMRAGLKSASGGQLTVEVPSGATYEPLTVFNKTTGLSGTSAAPFVTTFKSNGIIDTSSFKMSYPWPNFDKYPTSLSIGDLDGDGKNDLIFNQSIATGAALSLEANITVKGQPFAFKQPVLVDLGLERTRDVQLVDMDGDGKRDIVFNYGTDDRFFSILLNSSTPGNISVAPLKTFEIAAFRFDIGDFNGDGKPDVAFKNHYDKTLYILPNTSTLGKLSFGEPMSFEIDAIGSPTAIYSTVKVCDLDADHRPDIILSNGTDNAVIVFRNLSQNGSFAFGGQQLFATLAETPMSNIKTGDLNGDGKPEILVGDEGFGKKLSVLVNTSANGIISFKAPTGILISDFFKEFNVGDVNGDGKVDIAIANTAMNQVSVFINTSSGATPEFSRIVNYPAQTSPVNVSIGDMDGDSKPDLSVLYDYYNTFEGLHGIFILKNKISSVPVPTIIAGGPLSFTKGKSVILTANPGTGYTYQWQKDGVDIKDAIAASVTVAEKGNYTVTIAEDGEQATSAAVTVDVVFALPADNFAIAITSVTCKGSNNGIVNIVAKQALAYTVTITGNGLNTPYAFTTTKRIENLAAGTYSICITVAGEPDYKQCFDVVITEPKDLSLYSVVNHNDATLHLTLDGGEKYNIKVNGTVYTTSANEITVPLANGSNNVEVSTDKLCQGIIQRIFNISGKIAPYPVPFQHTLYLNVGESAMANIDVVIYNVADGKAVYRQQYKNQAGVLQMDLSALKDGVYSLHLSTGHTNKVFKIVKK